MSFEFHLIPLPPATYEIKIVYWIDPVAFRSLSYFIYTPYERESEKGKLYISIYGKFTLSSSFFSSFFSIQHNAELFCVKPLAYLFNGCSLLSHVESGKIFFDNFLNCWIRFSYYFAIFSPCGWKFSVNALGNCQKIQYTNLNIKKDLIRLDVLLFLHSKFHISIFTICAKIILIYSIVSMWGHEDLNVG